MSGIVYVHIILGLISVGVSFTLIRKIWNIIADIEIFGVKLPKI